MEINLVDVQGYDTLLLDRDGTINVHVIGDYVCTWDDFQFIPIALQTMPYFAKHFKHIFIVTNQRGIGKGKYTERYCASLLEGCGRRYFIHKRNTVILLCDYK